MSLSIDKIPRIGYGCMSLSGVFGAADHEESKATLRTAINKNLLIDGADVYGFALGFGHNEKLIGEVLAEPGMREKTFVVTKFGFTQSMGFQGGHREKDLKALDASIERLGTTPDAWIIHRIPKDVPIKDVVATLEEARASGKTKYIGLGEPSARTLREAAKYGKIDFIESEYSPFCLDLEDRGIFKACQDLDVKILAFSPLGKGFLTGQFKKPEDMGEFRAGFSPKFAKEVFDKNYRIVDALEKVAKKKGCTNGQLALAWAIAQSPLVIPIPGTRSAKRVEENYDATKVELTAEELKELRQAFEENRPEGNRYQDTHQKLLDED